MLSYCEKRRSNRINKHIINIRRFQSGDTNVSGTLGITDPSHPASLDCLKNVLATHRARRQFREVC